MRYVGASITLAACIAAVTGPAAAQQQPATAPAPMPTGGDRPLTPAPATSDAAPTPDAQARDSAGGDVVVTARRREESLQKVPVAVTALGAAQLAAKNIVDSADLATVTPSLYLTNGGFSSTNSNIALRGITSPGANITFDPSIGIYVDEVYLARNYGSLFDYFDVSGVQVLRGVQGTLFGRNNAGGAILISRTKPQWDNDGNAELGYGNYNAVKASVVQNLVLAPDLLAIRVGVKSDTRDGYGFEVNSGRRIGDLDSKTARASILFTPSSSSALQLTYEYNHHADSGPIFSPRSPTGRVVRPNLGFYNVAYDTPVYESGYDEIINGEGHVDIAGVRAKLIVAHLFGTDITNQDVDATDYATATLTNIDLLRRTTHRQDSVEFQLSGSGLADRLNYVAGVYYLGETAYQPTLNVVSNQQQRLYIDNDSKAVYGHLDAKLAEGLQLGGGIRYTDDRKSVRYGTFNQTTQRCNPAAAAIAAAPGYDAANCLIGLRKDNGYVSWDATLNYQAAPDILVYARAGRGQKSGGFNSAIISAADLVGYQPEIAQDFELGAKTQLFDRRLRLNVALYQTNYDQIQRNAITLIPGTTSTAIVVSNAAKGRIRGVEVETNLRLTDSLSLGGNYAYTDPVYLSFSSLNSAGQIIDQRNFPFEYVSRHQLGVTVAYDHEIEGLGRFKTNLDYAYRSRYSTYTSPDPLTEQAGFSLINGRISLDPRALPNLEVGVWVKNVLDKRYIVSGTNSGVVHFAVPGRPRMFGLDVKYHWGS